MNPRWSPAYQFLRDELRKVREQFGLTQVELASLLGKSQSYVSKIESGERKLDILEVRHYCRACGKDYLAFLASLEQGFLSLEKPHWGGRKS